MSRTEGTRRSSTDDGPRRRLRENAPGIASLLVTAIWLGAMFTGQSWWLAALLVGYVAVVPLVAILFGDETDREERADGDTNSVEVGPNPDTVTTESATDRRDALETLRDRYAAGELTDAQFERKLERLLDTETLEGARKRVRERNRERGGDREPEFER